MTGEEGTAGPLDGVRVIEFGQLIAGPCVGTLLGDFGADVIKVEPPGDGDALRQWGRARHNGHSLWWSVLARHKRSVALNLRDARDQGVALGLCAQADVVLENFRPGIAPSNVYRSADDKWVVIAANQDTRWRRLAQVMGQAELAEDAQFATHQARGRHQALLDDMIGEWAAHHTAAELDQLLNDAGVVCAPVYSVADILDDEWFVERGLLTTIEDEVHGTLTVPGVVPKLTGTPGRIRRPARWKVGADTGAVVAEFGLTDTQADREGRSGVEGVA